MHHHFTDFKQHQQRFDRTFRVVQWIIGIFIVGVFALTMAAIGVVIYVAAVTGPILDEQGLRGTIERVWCGKQPNCIAPFVEP